VGFSTSTAIRNGRIANSKIAPIAPWLPFRKTDRKNAMCIDAIPEIKYWINS